MSDNDDDLYHGNHFDYNDSDSDDDDDCDCHDCVARRGNAADDDDADHYFVPKSSVPQLCAQLRTDDISVLPAYDFFEPDVPNSCRLEIAEALLQNTIVDRIGLEIEDYGELSADAMAKYLAQNKHLLAVELRGHDSSHEMDPSYQQFQSSFIEAIGQSNSVDELSLKNLNFGSASEPFENLLARTKSLRILRVDLKEQEPLKEAETAAIIASGFSQNATLREIELVDWEETSRISALIALRNHPVLEKLEVEGFSSLVAMDALLRGKESQLKELTIARFYGTSGDEVVGFKSFMQEMGRNATILKMAIIGVRLNRDNIQQLEAMLHRNTVLQDLNLSGDNLGIAGLAVIASALYRNTSIQGLDISDNGLDNLASACTLQELLRRNKTITRLCMDTNTFGSSVAAVRCISEGFRTNTTLQELNLSACELDDQGLSILAESLGQQKRGLVKLDLSANQITCSGLRALVDNATIALSTVTHLNLSENSVDDEGAIFLAETLRLQTLPTLKYLQLDTCGIFDVGLVALMSALEENETLDELDLLKNTFSVQGYIALASSLPTIKGLRHITFSWMTSDPVANSAMLEGFRENTSLHGVNIVGGMHVTGWWQELRFFLCRNRFRRLLRDSDTDDRASLGLWSRALGSVATRPDVLFHVLTSKAGLIRATPREDIKKRKRDDSE
jgi:Ran GTPase-activating protein (RanGAP) involved in mRNA processing and transport